MRASPAARGGENDVGGEEGALDPYPLRYLEPDPNDIPRLLDDLPPIGGRIRVHAEDFEVEEIPLYSACGKGEHCYVTVVKTNRTTLQVRSYMARGLGISVEEIGFAGFKDRRAVAQQTFSIPRVRPEDVERLETHWLRVVDATFHRNKLRTGHLAGNRFRVRIRGVRPGALEIAREGLERLQRSGVPNFFGPQRYGHQNRGYRVGRELLHRNVREAVEILLGVAEDSGEEYRRLYSERKYLEALEALPHGHQSEIAILHALRRHPGNFRAAVRRIPRQLKRMYYSAYQSFLFNWCLRERMEWGMDAFQRPVEGDLVYIARKGACFLVEDEEEARARAEAGEICPSGPIFGRKMAFPTGLPGRLERTILEAEGLRPQSFLSHVKGLRLDGTRRPLRIPLEEVDCAEEEGGAVIALRFRLPPGSYATILLEQLMGPGATLPPPGGGSSTGGQEDLLEEPDEVAGEAAPE
ncbi:MAG: tRNA pseudouridine(13) synthase TruD [Planctomycetota bacterium]